MDESNRNALESSLLVVERGLHQIEDHLNPGYERSNSVLYFYHNDVDESSKARIKDTILSMIDEIRRMKEKFKLDTKDESAKRHISALLSEIWVILEDLRPEKLDAYGHMPKDDKEALRPHILRLLKKQDDIHQILSGT